tara:strand:+ start:159 stop:347 length:189 start_codon:yes stop_codon:yes gene_type:complete
VQAPVIPEKEDDPPILKRRKTDGTEIDVASEDVKIDTGTSATGGTTASSSLTIPKSKKKIAT